MTPKEIWTILVTVLIAVIGWIIGHYFSSQRDKKNKRREIITNHLIEAYRVLANDITRRKSTPESDKKLEQFISEIQLFGSLKQIELAKELAYKVQQGGTFYLDELLNDLRDDLRKELGLNKVKGNITWLRLKENKSFAKLIDEGK